MMINIKKRSGKFVDAINLSDDATVNEFKNLFYEKFHYYPERQWWNIDSPSGPPLKDGLLKENGVKNGTTLYFKDLGVQISWRLVFVLEYFGPILIFPVFYYFPNLIYGEKYAQTSKSLVQNVAFILTMIHYIKREMETLFVHRFSSLTMPIIRVPLNCGHYWVIFGIFVSYYLFHPNYLSPWNDDQKIVVYFLAALMIVFEILNFKCHLILRNLRPRGTKVRGIPFGYGFNFVSCANYTWEIYAWIVFAVLTQTFTAWLFVIVATLQMTQWAMKKHRIYKQQFKDYPRFRKAIFPFIL